MQSTTFIIFTIKTRQGTPNQMFKNRTKTIVSYNHFVGTY